MSKTGLNREQIEYIKNHYKKAGFEDEFSEEDIYWYLDEFGYIDTVEEDSRRHWTEYIAIVDLDGRFFGYHNARSDGDISANEKGFTPSNEINEYEAKEIKTTTFKLKK